MQNVRQHCFAIVYICGEKTHGGANYSLVSHQSSSMHFPSSCPLNTNNIKQTKISCTAVPNCRLCPNHVFDKYFSNWSWEKQTSKEYMWESKAVYHRVEMTVCNNPWLINKSIWNISTTVHLSPSCKLFSRNVSKCWSSLHRLWSQPGLTRIFENLKYIHKPTDGQSIQSEWCLRSVQTSLDWSDISLIVRGAMGKKGEGRRITCSGIMGSGLYLEAEGELLIKWWV